MTHKFNHAGTVKKMKGQVVVRVKIFSEQTFGEELMSRIHKELSERK